MTLRASNVSLGLVLSALASAQAAQTPEAGTESPPLFRGWLHELLDGDRSRARELYETAARVADDSDGQRQIALARLVELDQLEGDESALADHVEALRGLAAVRLERSPSRLDLPREEFAAVLGQPPSPERDAHLARLRSELTSDGYEVARGLVPAVVERVRRAETQRLRSLERELAEARRDGDRRRRNAAARELSRRLTPVASREAERRAFRNVRVLVVSSLVRGRLDQAEQYRRRLPWRLPSPPTRAPEDAATYVDRGVNAIDRWLAWPDLHRSERGVLDALRARLTKQIAAGQLDAAVDIVGRLPYRVR